MSSSTRLLPHRVLLVDDDADERDAIASFLELEGGRWRSRAMGRRG